jgi:tripartite-type tricarboxylate transporter receptor subunit TctC
VKLTVRGWIIAVSHYNSRMVDAPMFHDPARTGLTCRWHAVYAVCAVLAMAGAAHAQKPTDAPFPVRPVRLLVAQAAGGPTDVVARIYANRLLEVLGQQVVVDNRHGAGGSIAGELTARAPADGYTLMVGANGTLAVAPHLIKLSYDARKDLTPVALIGNSPLGLMVHPPLPAASFKELIALAKSRPGRINFGSSGTGATSHLAGEMLKMLAGINIVHVPYKGAGPSLIAMMSGEIEMMISGLSSGLPYVKQKQVRLLAVSSAKRVALLPDVPAMAETLPGYDVSSWYAVLAPAGTPRAIVERLHRASTTAVTTPDVQARLATAGVDVEPISPQELYAKLSGELDRWGKVVKAAGMKQN